MAAVVREFQSLRAGKEIVAGIYLRNVAGQIAFVDRLNNALLIANRGGNGVTALPLITTVVGPAKPSDVNHGTESDTLLVTFTDNNPQNGSKVIQYRLRGTSLREEWSVRFQDRTRTVALLDNDHLVATFQWKVRIYNRHTEQVVAEKDRTKRDKGGLVTTNMADTSFYFGDGNEFVGCQFKPKTRQIMDKFRYSDPDVKFPRGSAVLENGNLLVCCDESSRIVRLSADGRKHSVVVKDHFGFGDVDYDRRSREFLATRWPKSRQEPSVSPIIYRLG